MKGSISVGRRAIGTDEPWSAIAGLGPHLTYPAGFTLFRAGAQITMVYLLTTGVVKLVTSFEGEDLLVGIRTPDWLLGGASAICGNRHGSTIVALSECEVRPLAVEAFHSLRRTETGVGLWLQRRLSEELMDQCRRTAALVSDKHGEARLERLFVDLFIAAGRQDRDGSWKLTIALTVTEIGSLLGMGREWTSKILSKWHRNRVLEKRRGWFVASAGSRLATLIEAAEGDSPSSGR